MYKSLIRFILDSQNTDGSFGRSTQPGANVMTTAQVVCLIQGDSEAKTMVSYRDAAITYLRSQQHDTGKWTEIKPRPRETSMTALAVRALVNSGVPLTDPAVAQGAGWLVGKQKNTGEFVESDVVMRVVLYSHALTLAALAKLGTQYEVARINGIRWLRTVQNADGGFGMRSGEDSHATATSYVLLGIQSYRSEFQHTEGISSFNNSVNGALGPLVNKRMGTIGERAGDYLAKNQSEIGEWPSWVVDDFQVEGIAAGLAAYRLAGHRSEVIELASRLLMYRLGNISWIQIPIWQLVLSAEALR